MSSTSCEICCQVRAGRLTACLMHDFEEEPMKRPVKVGDVLTSGNDTRFTVERIDDERVWYVGGSYDYFCHGLHFRTHEDGSEIDNPVPFDPFDTPEDDASDSQSAGEKP